MNLSPKSMRVQRPLRQVPVHIQRSAAAGIARTNDGVCIAVPQGIPERMPAPFPSAPTAMRDPISQETSHAYPASPRRIVATA